MLGEIRRYTSEQFASILRRRWKRKVTSVHIHHTWRPRHADWRAEATVRAMRDFHVRTNGWSDIAQHLTIGPDGSLWGGRHLDQPPASAAGHNGTRRDGPLMIEMVGDFDRGENPFDSPPASAASQATAQADGAYRTVAMICDAFGLSEQDVFFHRDFTRQKTCPGTGIERDDFRAAVGARLATLAARNAPGERGFTPASIGVQRAGARYLAEFGEESVAATASEIDAEPACAAMGHLDALGAQRAFGFGHSHSFSESDRVAFRQHVINLEMGRLSDSGAHTTTESDLDALLVNLSAWIGQRGREPAQIVFFAHGGLVDERTALEKIVLRDLHWWLANGVYPIFFVWETGINEVFKQPREPAQDAIRGRGFSDLTDAALEGTLGPTLGRPTWRRIKNNAFLSSGDLGTGELGGAAIFARKFAAQRSTWTTGAQAAEVRLHAVGHSAGAIFHCHFLPALQAAQKQAMTQAPPASLLETLALLAPASRVDLFKQRLLPLVRSSAIRRFALFTMDRRTEEADDVAKLYRKSLLYFVRNACEEGDRPPILGLEESIRADADLAALFGLGPGASRRADVIWSPTVADVGRDASRATAHGAFDDDAACMNAVLRRVLDLADDAELAFPNLGDSRPRAAQPLHERAPADVRSAPASGGRRLALCVGINDYPDKPLAGCVADSLAWGTWLGKAGFSVNYLHDSQATKQAIVAAIDAMLEAASTGDSVVVQFAGHGTQLDDVSGDEPDRLDEAWVPHDYQHGEFLLDDELGALFDRYRAKDVELVLFTDCCHSGSSTRATFAPGAPQLRQTSRFLDLPAAVKAKFAAKQRVRDLQIRAGDSVGWEIHFAACQDDQSAYESGGNGKFTLAAIRALGEAPGVSLTYGRLADAMRQAFLADSLQTPNFRATPDIRSRSLWRTPADGSGVIAPGPDLGGGRRDDGEAFQDAILTRLQAIEQRLDELTTRLD